MSSVPRRPAVGADSFHTVSFHPQLHPGATTGDSGDPLLWVLE